MAHCSQSRLVCTMSGTALNENNQPMMLPNGESPSFSLFGTTKTSSENCECEAVMHQWIKNYFVAN